MSTINLSLDEIEIILTVLEEKKFYSLPRQRFHEQLCEITTKLYWHRKQIMRGLTAHVADTDYALCQCSPSMPTNTAGVCLSCNRRRIV